MTKMLTSLAVKAKQQASGAWNEISETGTAVFEFPVKVLLLHGVLHDDSDVTMLYIGRDLNLAHFKKKFFKETTTLQAHDANLLNWRKHAQIDADITFIDIGWPYHGRITKTGDYLELPDWVTMGTPMAETWDATVQTFRKTMRKNIRRLIRKNNYRCEPTHDPEFISRFYDDYYTAFINARHEGEVFMTSRALMERRAHEGVILKVMSDDGPVAAGVYYPDGDTFNLLDAGMPAHLVETPAEASMAALYYFSMEHAHQQGFKAVGFMGTRPFPTDGLFQFKRKWGAVVRDDFSIDSILFRPANTAKAVHFCERFPFVARKGDGLELILTSTAESLDESALDKLVSASHCDGLDPVRVVHVTDEGSPASKANGDTPNVIACPTPLTGFAQRYLDK